MAAVKEIADFLNDEGVSRSAFLNWLGDRDHVHVHRKASSADFLQKLVHRSQTSHLCVLFIWHDKRLCPWLSLCWPFPPLERVGQIREWRSRSPSWGSVSNCWSLSPQNVLGPPERKRKLTAELVRRWLKEEGMTGCWVVRTPLPSFKGDFVDAFVSRSPLSGTWLAPPDTWKHWYYLNN